MFDRLDVQKCIIYLHLNRFYSNFHCMNCFSLVYAWHQGWLLSISNHYFLSVSPVALMSKKRIGVRTRSLSPQLSIMQGRRSVSQSREGAPTKKGTFWKKGHLQRETSTKPTPFLDIGIYLYIVMIVITLTGMILIFVSFFTWYKLLLNVATYFAVRCDGLNIDFRASEQKL